MPAVVLAIRLACFFGVFGGMALWERVASRRRLFGTYREQPRAGHEDMTIGISTLLGMGMNMGGMMGMRHDIKAPSDNERHTLALYLQTHAK